jgi:hypothetical protein
LATDFRRPRPDRCDHEGRVKVGGRSSATPREKGSQRLALQLWFDFATHSSVWGAQAACLQSSAACRRNFSERFRLVSCRHRRNVLGSARVSRVGFGLAKTIFPKVRNREDACATRTKEKSILAASS